MAKIYVKGEWVDEVLAESARYTVKDDEGNLVYFESQINLSTEVTTPGTPVTADRMNNIEEGVDGLDDLVDGLETSTVKHSLATTANDFIVASGVGAFVKKTLAETLTILGKAVASGLASLDANSKVVEDPANATVTPTAGKIPIADESGLLNDWVSVSSDVVDDTTPQLGGDLDMNGKNIVFPTSEPGSDDTAVGIIKTFTVDTNAEGIGAPLAMAADGNLDTADADSVDNMPCIGLALETGTGAKKVLLFGVMRNDDWAWTLGAGAANLIYVDVTVGTLTQTKPTGEDDVVQPVGYALSDDSIFFNPSMIYITHTG